MVVKPQANKYTVPALDKGLDILEYIVTQQSSKSQTEIAHALNRGANEIYRVLVNLEARGYLTRDEASGKYCSSLKMYNLSRNISPVDKIRQCALPHMEDLAFNTGYSCYLSMLYQSQAMVIVNACSHSPISVSIAEGSIFSTTTTVSGRILLANSPSEVQSMILERDQHYQNLPLLQKESFINKVEMIKNEGLHCASNGIIEGVADLAVLVGEPNGLVIASLAISTIRTNQKNDYAILSNPELLEKLKNTAHDIAIQLGYD